MLSAYERRLILFYLSNAFSHLRNRDEEARNLLRWPRKHEDQLEIPYPLTAGDDAKRGARHKFRTRKCQRWNGAAWERP